jgi:hypothetical protein
MDRRARHADGLRHRAHATSSQGAGLNSSPQTQRGFVQPSRQSPILVLDRPYITHTRKVGDHPECSSYFCRDPKLQQPAEGFTTNRDFLRGVARLGGFLARKSDGEPGWLTIWKGWFVLSILVEGFELAQAIASVQ